LPTSSGRKVNCASDPAVWLMALDQEHAVETYKSLITISVEMLKALVLLNGGAVVALLAYVGQAPNRPQLAAHVRCPLAFFVAGLVSAGLAFGTSYLTQFALYNESVLPQRYRGPKHQVFLWITVTAGVLSLGSFSIGAFAGIMALAG
jgi:hypothetical protein